MLQYVLSSVLFLFCILPRVSTGTKAIIIEIENMDRILDI